MKNLKRILILFGLVLFAIGCSKDDNSAPIIELSGAKNITSFQFLMTDNPALTNHITTSINETSRSISTVVEGTTDITALVPNIAVANKATVSPTGAQDFSKPVVYTVTAEDGSESIYSATISVTQSDSKQINSFKFLASENVALSSDIEGIIDENTKTIKTTVPFGTLVIALTPSLEISTSATLALSGQQDFSAPVIYSITAEDGSTNSYTVTVTVEAPPSSGVILHQATASNTNGHISTIDDPITNGRSDAILIVTQLYGNTSVYNNNEVGVWYNRGKWIIFNENRSPMPEGAQFNVLVLPADSSNAFVHTATAANIGANQTTLNNVLTNAKPNALIYITQDYGIYNTPSVGVQFKIDEWRINNNGVDMPVRAKFNILVIEPGENVVDGLHLYGFKYTNTSISNISTIPLPVSLNSNSVLFTSQDWATVRNSHVTGVWKNGSEWTIFNQDKGFMPLDVKFNVLVAE